MAKMTSELNEADAGCSSGAKYLGFFSSLYLKTREKYISFVQLVLLSFFVFWGKCVTFQFLNDKIHIFVKKTQVIHNCELIIQKLESKHSFLKKYTFWAKLTRQS